MGVYPRGWGGGTGVYIGACVGVGSFNQKKIKKYVIKGGGERVKENI